MTPLPPLAGRSLMLRRPKAEDVADRLALGRSPEIVRMYGRDPAMSSPLTETEVHDSLNQLAQHPHGWAIEHDGRFLGVVRLDAISAHDQRATLAIGISDPAKLGMGLGREAVCLVLHHAFDALGLHRIGLRVIAYNERAIRCYRACGFSEEGREREAAFVAGEWHDDIMMGVLSREFAGLR